MSPPRKRVQLGMKIYKAAVRKMCLVPVQALAYLQGLSVSSKRVDLVLIGEVQGVVLVACPSGLTEPPMMVLRFSRDLLAAVGRSFHVCYA